MKKLLVLLLFCATAPLWAQPNTQYRMDDIMYHCDTFISINSHNRNYQDLHDGIDYSVYRRAKDAGAYCFVSPWCAETEQNWQPDPGD
jgi:hypothetical protein